MKKVNFKNVLTALVLALTFVVMGVQESNAQAINEFGSGIYSTPAGNNFVTKDVAEGRINDKIQEIKNLGANASPNMLAALEKQFIFYLGIENALQGGSTVPESIPLGLAELVPDIHNVSKTTLLAFRNEAIDLLSN